MNLLEALLQQPRSFIGEGRNHAQENFIGQLKLEPLVGGRALLLHYKATGTEEQKFHEETTLLSTAQDGKLCLWPVMEELPFVLPHPQIGSTSGESGSIQVVFGNAPRAAAEIFREEITIELRANGHLVYSHAWGMPGGTFEERSSCVLVATET